ncbi:MAG: DNA recombination protein RmuC [Rhodospirillales bacterium]
MAEGDWQHVLPYLLLLGGLLLATLWLWRRLRVLAARDRERTAELASAETRLAERDLQRAEMTAERERLQRELETLRRQSVQQQQELARLGEAQDLIQQQAEEKLALLSEARERMTKEFKLLSAEILARQGQDQARQQEQRLTGLLTPLQRRIGDFQESLQVVQRESAKERAGLSQQIKGLLETSQDMRQETRNLTRALKGESQAQGAWGEMLLASILERSGLREGQEFFSQVSHADGEGGRLRPDVIVPLPNGERIVIDAKVSLTAFESYVNAETPADRELALAAHLRSLRGHIRGLGGKGYHALGGPAASGQGPEFVILFLPIEAALSVAWRHSGDLMEEALQRDVVVATPTSLMIALKTVHNLWRIEGRTRNVEEMAKRGGLLYDKFVGFVEDMQALDQRLKQARFSYDEAFGKLSTGSGNLVGQAEKLRELGAKTRKSLAGDLLAQSGALDEPADEIPGGLTVAARQPSYPLPPEDASDD